MKRRYANQIEDDLYLDMLITPEGQKIVVDEEE